MKKLLMMLTMFLLCGLVTLPVHAQEVLESENPELTVAERFKRGLEVVSESSVKIFQLFDHGGMGVCSGTLITNDEETVVLTAKHCIDTMSIEIYADGVRVKSYGVDNKYDVAWLILEDNIIGKKPIKFSTKNVNLGDFVFVFAYPPKHNPYIEVGTIKLKTFKYYYASLEVIGGCSGGGVFNVDGELVGVLWGSVSDMTIFTPLHDVKNILIRNKIRYHVANY